MTVKTVPRVKLVRLAKVVKAPVVDKPPVKQLAIVRRARLATTVSVSAKRSQCTAATSLQNARKTKFATKQTVPVVNAPASHSVPMPVTVLRVRTAPTDAVLWAVPQCTAVTSPAVLQKLHVTKKTVALRNALAHAVHVTATVAAPAANKSAHSVPKLCHAVAQTATAPTKSPPQPEAATHAPASVWPLHNVAQTVTARRVSPVPTANVSQIHHVSCTAVASKAAPPKQAAHKQMAALAPALHSQDVTATKTVAVPLA